MDHAAACWSMMRFTTSQARSGDTGDLIYGFAFQCVSSPRFNILFPQNSQTHNEFCNKLGHVW